MTSARHTEPAVRCVIWLIVRGKEAQKSCQAPAQQSGPVPGVTWLLPHSWARASGKGINAELRREWQYATRTPSPPACTTVQRKRDLRSGWPLRPCCLAFGFWKGGGKGADQGVGVMVQQMLPRPHTSDTSVQTAAAGCPTPTQLQGWCTQPLNLGHAGATTHNRQPCCTHTYVPEIVSDHNSPTVPCCLDAAHTAVVIRST
jgi:hypothetical protein